MRTAPAERRRQHHSPRRAMMGATEPGGDRNARDDRRARGPARRSRRRGPAPRRQRVRCRRDHRPGPGRRRSARLEHRRLCAAHDASPGRRPGLGHRARRPGHGRREIQPRHVGRSIHRPQPRRLGLLAARQGQRVRLPVDLHARLTARLRRDPAPVGDDHPGRGRPTCRRDRRARLPGGQPHRGVLAGPRAVPGDDGADRLRAIQSRGIEDLPEGRRRPVHDRRADPQPRLCRDAATPRPSRRRGLLHRRAGTPHGHGPRGERRARHGPRPRHLRGPPRREADASGRSAA